MAANGYVEETLALRMVKGLCRRRGAPVEGALSTVCEASNTCAASDESDGGWTPIVWPEAAPTASETARQLTPVPAHGNGAPEIETAAAAAAPARPRSSGADARGWPRRIDIAPDGRLLRRERGPGEVPGSRRGRRLAPVGLAAAALIPFGGAAAQGALAMAATPAAAAVLPHTIYTGSPPVVDGKLDALYSGSFSAVSYTETGGKHTAANGQLSVIETPDAYYIGFQQGLTFKSNAYCPTTGNPADCYQRFRDLTGSDHISFVWNVAGKTIQVGVDILTANSAAPLGYSGMVKTPLTGNIGEGLSLLGCDPSGVTGFSGMDYNWHHAGGAGWGADPQAGSYSPNFVGKAAQYPDYVYPSTAEVRLSKAACGLSDGTDMTHPAIIAHDSPEAPWSTVPQKFLVCDVTNPVTAPVGTTVDLTVDLKTVDPMTGNTTPTANQAVVTGIANGPAQRG